VRHRELLSLIYRSTIELDLTAERETRRFGWTASGRW
jgi:hypothetical protein